MWLYGILGSLIGGVIVAVLAMLATRASYEKHLIASNSIKAWQVEMLEVARGLIEQARGWDDLGLCENPRALDDWIETYNSRMASVRLSARQHEMLHRAARYMKGLAEAGQTAGYLVNGDARPEIIMAAIEVKVLDDATKWLAEFESQEEEFRKRHWRSPSKGKGRVPDPEEKERSDGR